MAGLPVAPGGHGVLERAAAGDAPRHHRLPAAARPQGLGRGPAAARAERRWAFRPAAILRRSPEVRAEGARHPLGR